MDKSRFQFHIINEKNKVLFLIAYAFFLSMHHFIRLFDNSFWGDEGIVINLAREGWMGMLEGVAYNGHSPFHYAFAWICVRFFGESGFIYHFSATLPYFIIIILAVTLVRKWLGVKVAIIFITFCSLLNSAIVYNLEVRMYAWCQLFIFIVFLVAYQLFVFGKNGYYFLLAVVSLGAVYSHYFALASIGIIYFMLFIHAMKTNRGGIWKVIVSGASVIVLLMPWLFFAMDEKGAIITNYGIEPIGYVTCIGYIFQTNYKAIKLLLLAAFFTVFIINLNNDTYILDILHKEKLGLKNSFRKLTLTNEWVWMLSGVIAVFGTIILSETFTQLFFPIIGLRYLYPSYVILWLIFAINVSKIKFNKLWMFILMFVIFVSCYPSLISTIQAEQKNNQRLESTLKITQSEIDENSFIYTDIVHFAWTVAGVYYRQTPHDLFGHDEWWGPAELPELDIKKTDFWLFLGNPISEEVARNLRDQELDVEIVVDKGYIGTGDVWIYKIIQKNRAMEGN